MGKVSGFLTEVTDSHSYIFSFSLFLSLIINFTVTAAATGYTLSSLFRLFSQSLHLPFSQSQSHTVSSSPILSFSQSPSLTVSLSPSHQVTQSPGLLFSQSPSHTVSQSPSLFMFLSELGEFVYGLWHIEDFYNVKWYLPVIIPTLFSSAIW